jgi:hypothetical protein
MLRRTKGQGGNCNNQRLRAGELIIAIHTPAIKYRSITKHSPPPPKKKIKIEIPLSAPPVEQMRLHEAEGGLSRDDLHSVEKKSANC